MNSNAVEDYEEEAHPENFGKVELCCGEQKDATLFTVERVI